MMDEHNSMNAKNLIQPVRAVSPVCAVGRINLLCDGFWLLGLYESFAVYDFEVVLFSSRCD